MKLDKLPVRLTAEPLVEAVAEVRFAAAFPASNVLPGMLFQELRSLGTVQIEQMPAAQVPAAMRNAQPELQFAALVRIRLDNFVIGIADSAVSISFIGKYPGWVTFRAMIMRVIRLAIESGVMQRVERYSLKYLDVIPRNDDGGIGLDLDLRLGETRLDRQVAQIKLEVADDPFIHIVQVVSEATVNMVTGETYTGALVDVDTITANAIPEPGAFLESLEAKIDDAHLRNKRVFFESLTEKTLKQLGPQYE